jgi:hypothetical protein
MKIPSSFSHPAQRGQSIAEFLVALAVLTPLFMAVAYAGKYGDLQLSATQASRYAAFQRAREPSTARLSDETLADQMRTRFFIEGDYLNKGKLQSDDSITKIAKDKGGEPVWVDLAGKPLMSLPLDKAVTVSWVDAPLGTGAVADAMGYMTKTAGKTYPGGRVAQIEVTLENKLDLLNATPKPLVIAAATAAAGNTIGSGGSQATRDAAATIVPTSYIPDVLSGFFELALSLFEPYGPELGCIKPDVVPNERLDGSADNSKCM